MGSFKGTHPEILCKSTVLKNSAKFCKNWKYLRQSLFSKFETGNEVPQSQMFSCVYILQNLLEHLRYCFIDDLWNDFMILQVQKWYSFMSCFINKNYSLCKFCYYIYLWLCWKTFSYRVLFIQYSVVSIDF